MACNIEEIATRDAHCAKKLHYWKNGTLVEKFKILLCDLRYLISLAPDPYQRVSEHFEIEVPDTLDLIPKSEREVVAIKSEYSLAAAEVLGEVSEHFPDILSPEFLLFCLLCVNFEFSQESILLLGQIYPLSLVIIAKSLICSGLEEIEDRKIQGWIGSVLIKICGMFPWTAFSIRDHLLEEGVLPNTALIIAEKYIGDTLEFMIGVFTSQPDYLKPVCFEENNIFTKIKQDNIELFSNLNSNIPGSTISLICARLKLTCGMVGILNMAHTSEELDLIESILQYLQPASRAHDMCIALSLMSRTQGSNYSKTFLQTVLSETPENRLSEFLLMVRVCFRTNRLDQVEYIFRQLIGLNVKLSSKCLLHMRLIFSKDSHNDELIAAQALNIKKTGHIYTAVVLHLLNAQILQNSGLDIFPWIQYNICNHPLDLDKNFLEIMSVYVESLYKINTFSAFPESFLKNLQPLTNDPQDISRSLLILYYLLLNNSYAKYPNQTSEGREYRQLNCDHTSVSKILYLAETIESSPIAKAIFPHLMGLIADQYQELVEPNNFLHKENKDHMNKIFSPKVMRSCIIKDANLDISLQNENESIKTVLNNTTDPTLIKKVLEYLVYIDPFESIKYSDSIIEVVIPLLVTKIKSGDNYQQLKSYFVFFWTTCYTITPRDSCTAFVDVAVKTLARNRADLYSHNSFRMRPILLFNIFDIFVECAEILHIFLYTLRYYIIESRNYIQWLSKHNSTGGQDMRLCNSIIDLQESCIVQVLLELCSMVPAQAPEIHIFVHQMFIEKASLIKLVINQGFNIQLIPMVVDSISSIPTHFIPKLLEKASKSSKIFLLNLVAHLFKKYTIEKSLTMACDLIMPTIKSLMEPVLKYKRELRETPYSSEKNFLIQLPNIEDIEISTNLLPVLLTLAKAFPVLLLQIAEIIRDLSPKNINAEQKPVEIDALSGSNASDPVFISRMYLEKLQIEANKIFKNIKDSVYLAPPNELDKSIVGNNSELDDLRAYKYFYYGA